MRASGFFLSVLGRERDVVNQPVSRRAHFIEAVIPDCLTRREELFADIAPDEPCTGDVPGALALLDFPKDFKRKGEAAGLVLVRLRVIGTPEGDHVPTSAARCQRDESGADPIVGQFLDLISSDCRLHDIPLGSTLGLSAKRIVLVIASAVDFVKWPLLLDNSGQYLL